MVDVDGFAEANQLLSSALEQLDNIIAGVGKDAPSEITTTNNHHDGTINIINSSTRTNGDDHNDHYRKNSLSSDESPPSDIDANGGGNGANVIMRLFDQLIMAIDATTTSAPLPRPDPEMTLKLVRWLMPVDDDTMQSPSPSMSTVSCPEYPELQEKLHRLAMARDSLSLQVSVLAEQVGAQKDKIRDLESMLDDKKNKLDSTEEMLQDELVNRSDFESKKLDLMSEVSTMKLKYASLEREKLDTERKLRLSKAEIDHLNKSMLHKTTTRHIQQQSTMVPQLPPPMSTTAIDQTGEMEQLRLAVQQLLVDNEHKNMQIDSLRSFLEQQMWSTTRGVGYQQAPIDTYQQQQQSSMMMSANTPVADDFDINVQLRRLLMDENGAGVTVSEMPYSTSYPLGFSATQQQQQSIYQQQPYMMMPQSHTIVPSAIQSSSSYTSSLSTASPQHSWSNSGTPRHQLPPSLMPAASSSLSNCVVPPRSPSSPAARQLAAELDELRRIGGDMLMLNQSTGTSSSNTMLNHYNTNSLPRSLTSNNNKSSSTLPRKKLSSISSSTTTSAVVAGGEYQRPPRAPPRSSKSTRSSSGLKWLRSKVALIPSKRSTSAPNLVESDDELVRGGGTAPSQNSNKFRRDRTRTSLRNLFGKLRRSSSQEIKSGAGDFRRGTATRATTTAARIGSLATNGPIIVHRPPVHIFVHWTCEQICEWMSSLGLTAYVPEARRYIRSGRHLLSIGPHELEKDLGMKCALHRKRLRLALRGIELGASIDPAERMDAHQVMRWLDDVGLPQYRDVFAENLIDGSMLIALTAQDLVQMRIHSALHHATIARGIQYLRANGFDLSRIERRFSPEIINKRPCPRAVEQWSQHCTSDWLRTIDLAEFTPNLLCAGIHGALMVLEPTFTAESLAEVLQMPAHKTLLRRHLSTHFTELLGNDIIYHKRDVLAQPFVAQLTPGLKVRLLRKGFSLSRKKSKNEVYVEPDELVCQPASLPVMPAPSHQIHHRTDDMFHGDTLDSLTASNV